MILNNETMADAGLEDAALFLPGISMGDISAAEWDVVGEEGSASGLAGGAGNGTGPNNTSSTTNHITHNAGGTTATASSTRLRLTLPTMPTAPPASTLADMILGSLLSDADADAAAAGVSAMNTLLMITFDFDANYALDEAGGAALMAALVALFDHCIGWDTSTDTGTDTDTDTDTRKKATSAWTASTPWSRFCKERLTVTPSFSSVPNRDTTASQKKHGVDLAQVKLMEAVAMVLRNLSYVAANHRYLLYSTDVVRILCACLYYRGSASTASEEESEASGGGRNKPGAFNNMCHNALQALFNLAPHMDPTGRKFFADWALLPTHSHYFSNTQQLSTPSSSSSTPTRVVLKPEDRPRKKGRRTEVDETDADHTAANRLGFGGMLLAKRYDGREETNFSRIPHEIVKEIAEPYIAATMGLFPALAYALDMMQDENNNDNDDEELSAKVLAPPPQVRSVLVLGLELLKEWLDASTMEHDYVFLDVPDALLARLVEFLWIPRLGPDSVEYVDPICNLVSRVPTLKLMNGYDATVDYELRDRTAEVLVLLTNLSPNMKRRLGTKYTTTHNPVPRKKRKRMYNYTNNNSHNISRLYDALVPMIGTKVGRNDAPTLAGKLLANLAMVPENAIGIRYVEGRLIENASRDAQVSNLVCNGILNQLSN